MAVWDIANETLLWKDNRKSIEPKFRMKGIELSPNGEYAYFEGDTVDHANLMVYNISQRSIVKMADQKGYIQAIKLSPDGRYLAVGYNTARNAEYSVIALRDAESMAR